MFGTFEVVFAIGAALVAVVVGLTTLFEAEVVATTIDVAFVVSPVTELEILLLLVTVDTAITYQRSKTIPIIPLLFDIVLLRVILGVALLIGLLTCFCFESAGRGGKGGAFVSRVGDGDAVC